MSETSDPRIHRPHVARNRDSIVDVLRRVLPGKGLVLEVASGSGEHAAYFAAKFPALDGSRPIRTRRRWRVFRRIAPMPVCRTCWRRCIST